MTTSDVMRTTNLGSLPQSALIEAVETLRRELMQVEAVNARRNELAMGELSRDGHRADELRRERDEWEQKYRNLFKKVFQPLSLRERLRGRIDLR